MENRKRHKKGQVSPSKDEKQHGSENLSFLLDDMSETAGSKDKLHSNQPSQNSSKVTIDNNFSGAIRFISNVKGNVDQWLSYTNTRRVRKKKLPDDEDCRELTAGLGLDEISEDSAGPARYQKSSFNKDSHMASVHNHALIQYFARLGQSKREDETIDLEVVHSLLRSGADINCTDRHGQTILHEVARAWHVDVARYLIEQGADVNKGDKFGRTPLHTAAAVDYVDMVNLLIEKKANKEARTLVENQTPVFYAARVDAIQSLKALILKHGCEYKSVVDYKGRTPIHVAAELDRSETARLLLECEAPVYFSDNQGARAITWMIIKMAPVAKVALNQLYSTDRANRKQYFALNHLVCDKTKDPLGKVQTPLHMAVGFKQYDLLMHPAFRRLLDQMWNQFGRFWAVYQLGINFVYIVMWTVIGIVVEYDKRHEYNMPDDAWRIVLYLVAVAFTLYQIIDEFMEFRRSARVHTHWEQSRRTDIMKDMQFCHPRWPEERKYLEMEIGVLERQHPKYFHDYWNIFDWICYIMLIICIATHIADIISHTELVARAHIRLMTVTIVFLWLRLMKNARAFSLLGPFIVMLGHMLKDCLKFLFLYMEFYIPYLAAFWMTYGGTKKMQDEPNTEISVSGFEYPGQIFFSVFRLTLVDDYDYDNMKLIDNVMADILLFTWFILSAILCLNLFIALLSDTFQRVYDNAQANAIMQRAITILNIWEGINIRRKNNFLLHIETNCSPLKEEYDDDLTLPEDDDLKKVTMQIKEDFDSFQEMFKLHFGDPRSMLNEHGDVEGNLNTARDSPTSGQVSLQKLESELRDLGESLRSVTAQQESTAALLHKDMSLIKSMLKELLDKGSGGERVAAVAYPDSSAISEQTPLSKMKRRKKKRPVNTGLEIDVIDGSAQSAEHGSEPASGTLEFSPAVFQDVTRSAEPQVFGVNILPPPRRHHDRPARQKDGTDNKDTTNC